MKNLIAICIFVLIIPFCSCQAQSENKGKGIRWMSFEEAVSLSDKTPKKMFIDVYTDWCGWCKKMDAGTFQDSAVVAYMNEHYYAVKLNAETKDTIRFRDNVFVYRPEYKANDIALSLLNGKMGYPSFVILDEGYSIARKLSGYQTTDELLPILKELNAPKQESTTNPQPPQK